MRYHIDTIPVWDAVKLDSECPLCALYRLNEQREAEYYLGASVMEPDVRIRVNERGFCLKHHALLYGLGNRLGQALMLESHMDVTREALRKRCDALREASRALAEAPLGAMSRRGAAAMKDFRQAAEALEGGLETCVMCDSIRENMNRYLYSFLHLWQNDSEFRRTFSKSKGLCLPHLRELLAMAAEALPARELADFTGEMTALTERNFERVRADLGWFIKKKDYRFQNEPWNGAQDAVPRAIGKLRGALPGDKEG